MASDWLSKAFVLHHAATLQNGGSCTLLAKRQQRQLLLSKVAMYALVRRPAAMRRQAYMKLKQWMACHPSRLPALYSGIFVLPMMIAPRPSKTSISGSS